MKRFAQSKGDSLPEDYGLSERSSETIQRIDSLHQRIFPLHERLTKAAFQLSSTFPVPMALTDPDVVYRCGFPSKASQHRDEICRPGDERKLRHRADWWVFAFHYTPTTRIDRHFQGNGIVFWENTFKWPIICLMPQYVHTAT